MGGNVGGAVDGFEGTGFGFSAGGAAGISPGAFSVTNSVVVGVVDSFCVASSVLIVVAEVDSSRAGAADVDSDDNKDSVVAVVAGDGVLSGTTGASEIFVVVSLVN